MRFRLTVAALLASLSLSFPAIASTASNVGGATPFFNDSVSSASVQIKATGAQLCALNVVNTTGATAYLQVFGKPAATVSVGTTPPDWVLRIPGTGSIALDFSTPMFISSGTGLSVAGTTTSTGSTPAILSVGALYR